MGLQIRSTFLPAIERFVSPSFDQFEGKLRGFGELVVSAPATYEFHTDWVPLGLNNLSQH